MKLSPMRLFSTLMLVVALISQGAVARVHLMPDMSPAEMSAMHGHHDMAAQASHHDAMAHCMAQSADSHDCCESMTQPTDCHDASAPCNGECGMCKVFSPAGVALLSASPQLQQPSPERAVPQAKFFHSVALSPDSKPPIA
ncbi:hypothetical protein [Ferrimonas balearica]|uniref:hypothetical protein n=1 Tax=Ferrimonas balearica TaxID=44012 RepID=UPI001C57E687|nr:hypothetical protein [Ferrimonas balearica]MBW3141203.1 hypothetical protein [Ferrimonas balearica]MBY6108236.1 hypothetical protein [Ferrimonas balearica]MBY6225628.1 hypothetical protein [Ferrimonas balearica]